MMLSGIITETEESKRQDMTLHHYAGHSVGSEPEVAQVPKAGSILELARPETAGDAPRDLTSRSATSRSDEESWDFDGDEQDFGEEQNPPKPHANP
jgi:hypothetical protein